MPVVYSRTSPYFNTPQRNFLINFLDLYTVRRIPSDLTDEIISVSPKFHERPDLLSNDLYGTPELWWIFAVRNPNEIIDPIYDLVSGLEIFVPTQQRLLRILGL